MANPPERTSLRDRAAAGSSRGRILIVESDPVVSDLIGRQALQSVGYQVQVATDATSAISKALQWSPDLLLVDLNLPGLSGKDLLVALASQGIQIPLIILAQRGMEADLIQTFRLGAADYLLLPAREAEVVNAVHRVLQQVNDRRERERLALQLQQANQELQSRVRELTTIFALGKAMTSVTDQAALLEKILEAAVHVTQADVGWFLLREDVDKPFVVAAEHHLPPVLGVRLNMPWDDGISSLVAMSGEALTIHGEPFKRFKISSLGLSALIVPIKMHKKVIGLLTMLRKAPTPFGPSEQHLVDALADYASISLVNARLFRTMEQRARSHQFMAESAQVSEKVKNDLLLAVKKELAAPAEAAQAALDKLIKDPTSHLRPETRQQLAQVHDRIEQIQQVAEAITPLSPHKLAQVNLNSLVFQALHRFQPYSQRAGVTITQEVTSEALLVTGDSGLLNQAVDGLLSYMLRISRPGDQLVVRLAKNAEHQAHLLVYNSARVIAPKEAEQAFDETAPARDPAVEAGRFAGLGVRLPIVKEIVSRGGGKAWLESQAGKGSSLHISLPLAR